MVRIVVAASKASPFAAVLAAAGALLCHWGINAEILGAHDAGWALYLSLAGAVTLAGATYAAPALVLAGLGALYWDRPSALRFLLAGGICALPVALLTWL